MAEFCVEFEAIDNTFDTEFEGFTPVSDGGYERGYADGYAKGDVDGQIKGKAEGQDIGYADALAKRTDLVATANGEYTPSEDSTGFKRVSVAVSGKLPQVLNKTVTQLTAEDLQGTTSIGDYAFQECRGLQSVVFPDSLTTIGQRAFYNCRALEKIEIPSSVKKISQGAFYYCKALESVDFKNGISVELGVEVFNQSGIVSISFPQGISTIESFMCSGCSKLETVEIPTSVTSIGGWAFQSCTALKIVKLKPKTPPIIQSSTFSAGVPSDCVYMVDYGCGDAYRQATNWSAFANQIVEGDV